MIILLRSDGHCPHREGDRLLALAFSMGGSAFSPCSPAGRRGPEVSDGGVGSAHGIRRLRSAPPARLIAPLRAALVPAGEKRRKL
ncbi:hypothetical protein GGE12_002115 [Rhizobium mongolense]|uniref:Uncharacterized protein n=1 Tax=Rhizobium mongolense TaxID=57676 RepID=A0A7W6WE72_9HYPH|nr:hypothetical protein [Rhizobium mongolense]